MSGSARRSAALVLFGLLWPLDTGAQSLVGQVATSCTGSPMSCQSTSGIAVSAGDLLVGLAAGRLVGAAWEGSIAVSDGTNTWTCPTTMSIYNGANQVDVSICYVLSSAAGTFQPTFSQSQTTNSIYWSFSAWTGTGTWSFDQANEATNGNGTSHSHGSITTTGAGLIVTTAAQSSGVTDETANASFTPFTLVNLREYWQYWLTGGAQTTTGVYTSVTAHGSSAAIGSFKFTASGGATNCKNLLLTGVGGAC